jgi:hypothetical protein
MHFHEAINHGYLKECPNLTAHGIKKYLNPSPAMAKGHMRRTWQGICSKHCVPPINEALPVEGQDENTIWPMEIAVDNESEDSILMPPQIQHKMANHANIIESNNDLDANIFVFAIFADKRTGTLYSDLTGTFPFMSLKGSVCFLIVYHCKSNAILVLPIANFADESILAANQTQLELLESKGCKIRLNLWIIRQAES